VNILDLIKKIISQVRNLNKRFVFPEGEDERILKAISFVIKKRIIKPIVLGDENEIKRKAKKYKINVADIEIINPKKNKNLMKYAHLYSKKSKIPLKTAELITQKPLFYATLMIAAGDADCLVAGAVYSSGEVIAVCKKIIGLQKGISVPSSFFLMNIPNYSGGEKGNLIYSDASVNPNPSAKELADIALISGQTAKRLFGWDPRVALLSFSTKGSAEHPDVCKVVQATELAKMKAKGMKIDGEFQADTALVPEVAKKKIKGKAGLVAGKANVLIFPDLDAGNIAYKLTQRLAGAKAYGPFLQGFASPVSDLSRGATVEDIIGVIAVLSYWSKRWKK